MYWRVSQQGHSDTMQSPNLRDVLLSLRTPRNARPAWPIAMLRLLEGSFEAQRSSGVRYDGPSVLLNRTRNESEIREFAASTETTERPLVKKLFARCFLDSGQVLMVDEEPVWLLTFEAPNQGGDQSNESKGRRADLVGLRRDGSLVVFEAKRAKNTDDSPLSAVVEGLDYLASLLAAGNLGKLQADIDSIRGIENESCPEAFHNVEFDRLMKPAVYVIAPAAYYASFPSDPSARNSNRVRGEGWARFAELFSPQPDLKAQLHPRLFDMKFLTIDDGFENTTVTSYNDRE